MVTKLVNPPEEPGLKADLMEYHPGITPPKPFGTAYHGSCGSHGSEACKLRGENPDGVKLWFPIFWGWGLKTPPS